jgi:hypothetical protein
MLEGKKLHDVGVDGSKILKWEVGIGLRAELGVGLVSTQ